MPSEGVYVDTSVLGAYYCPEPLSETAESALRKVRGPVVSSLSDVEFCSLISRKRRLKELTERQAGEILNLFDAHVAEGFYRRIALSAEHFFKARQLILVADSGLRTLDALHLAAAVTESLTMLTADREFAKAARRFKAEAILIK
jgi:predicted nucleic acid-binding protein